MRNRLTELSGQIEYSTCLESFVQNEHAVTAIVSGKDGRTQTIHAAWIVGCDGAHSTVRKQLGVPFEGTPSETWMIADINVDWELHSELQDTVFILFSEEGALVAFPFPETNHWRLLDINPNLALGTDQAVVEAELTRKVRAALGSSTALVHSATWVSSFTIQQRRVPFARVQRAFLAGDSAHCHSPASAQGMNTGVQDAFNLGWKLAQVCRRQAPESLLDSYSIEREPVAASVLEGTQAVTRFLSMHDANGRWMRNNLISVLTNHAVIRETFMKRVVPSFFELGVAYRQSPLVAEHWHPSFAPYDRQPAGLSPGDRVPDYPFEYAKGRPLHTLHEFLNAPEYSLLLFTAYAKEDETYSNLKQLAQSVKQTFGDLVAPLFVVPNPHIQNRLKWDGVMLSDIGHPYHTLHYYFGASQPSVYLIRPDGYVAYRDQPANATRVLAYLHSVLYPATPGSKYNGL
jgi:2-polyprenyl-6-methoxyphenol hydroxylase-like FAD-dependent oxidoreductase